MTIKRNLQCPNCDGRVFLHFRETRGDPESGGQLSRVDAQWSLWWEPSGSGSFETFVCKACGFTEWYAHGLSLVRPDPERGISVIDATAPGSGSPFR
jgi:DNA-directed RNA polymerase subunit RPC12/RpoP